MMAETPKNPADSGKPAESASATPGGRPVESASSAPGEKRSASRPQQLAKASESGDPAVHQLLAERQTAQMNLDATESAAADEDRAKARDDLERATAALADLGFE
jgi:hypothetical protein